MVTGNSKLKEILEEKFSMGKYCQLIEKIFPTAEMLSDPEKYKRTPDSKFEYYVASYSKVAEYITPESQKLIILAIELNKEGNVENARSAQRNYAKRLIENSNSEAAIIAFYAAGEPKWRLSFVRLDYERKLENGKVNIKDKLTPAKRYSFLVGEGEPSRTAIDRINGLIAGGNSKPALADIEKAFSVQKVSEDFFIEYRKKFEELRDYLDQSEDFIIESKQHNFTSTQFAKKLMGQIVFLYFLQKKGWLGVKSWPDYMSEDEYKDAYYAHGSKSRELIPLVYHKDSTGEYKCSAKALKNLSDEDQDLLAQCVKGKPWGTGPNNFMRQYFEYAKSKGGNFYNKYLEYLFYDALNRNRGEQSYWPYMKCKMPFLSGELFEPIDGYDWKHNNFDIPDEIFSNIDQKGEYEADGILDIFDRYNFTISEDEPMEHEVAIDPEMLGQVFESMLEENIRRDEGAFYTPKEVVYYMCQESLIEYLTKELNKKVNIDRDAISKFILYGDIMKDEDTDWEKRRENGGMLIDEKLFKLDKDDKIVVDHLSDMETALKKVRIADPAVGSGAFPVGMLNEIVKARQNIVAYHTIGKSSKEKNWMYSLDGSAYSIKRDTIKNCLFAVDINPSAVDIAQLRLWLSLVIDDVVDPDKAADLGGHKDPIPLPNLESNIICGDSLVDSIDGVRLIQESELLENVEYQTDVNYGRFKTLIDHLIVLQEELYESSDPEGKKKLKNEIAELKNEIVLTRLNEFKPEIREKYEETVDAASKPYVLWQLDFAKVFNEKGGFDIVIGNPPYVQLQKTTSETGTNNGKKYANMDYSTFAKSADIYCLFYEKGYRLLHEDGVLAFITSNKWMRTKYGRFLRDFFATNTNPIRLIDLEGLKVFKNANVDANILLFSKGKNLHKTSTCWAGNAELDSLRNFVDQNSNQAAYINSGFWILHSSPLEYSIKEKVDTTGTPLCEWNLLIKYGVKTGYNDAFIIDGTTKDALIAEDPKSAKIIHPTLQGRDITRYTYNSVDKWLIATLPSLHYDINDYPAVKDYLLSFSLERLEQTGEKHIIDGVEVQARKKTNHKWYEAQDAVNYWEEFSKQKIMYGEIGQEPKFILDDGYFYPEATTFFITGENLIPLLLMLNSQITFNIFKTFYAGAGLGEKGTRCKEYAFETLPLPQLNDNDIATLESYYKDIQASGGVPTEEMDNLIDEFMAKKYGFTDEEFEFLKKQ